MNLFTCVDQTMFCLESYLDPNSAFLYPAGKSLTLELKDIRLTVEDAME